MDKKTQTWLEIAENDLEFAEQIVQNQQRPYYAMHFCHQAIEKLLKGVVQHETGKIPPRTHNLEKLLQLTKKELPSEKLEILVDLAPHYLSTKYPEDLEKFYKQYSIEFVRDQAKKIKELF
ncbi:MAG: hypothetical protein A2W61_03590 [Deltaproteobacteria bacterium RIFCSPLOWO2_01_44_7]|nr:MAG: hypothetical protein A2712_08435 [Deltaproteobacteria bacterium RIFCSPHIGHO2_01_FULL_43_49]OGQ14635.1 MAG: hypothetical protein A3D22_08565 [Deltaproteobacteria bacterium RIFCSPHIGHO2_02_FULL_44_53]OGQ28021.1 MAG: hypothetical protein A3D98_07275 [Deltaproteobacteria bacterium RIFCSPHIGHO2_12_FULL_44_21]OGQ31233.1 MAG: hypothetical protein A2979_07325 [Deltaproteobacteria bacterium RIFCSPLOWO2_01_FULL_45_74]OGQ42694.1 MAG: hypothetical protein A2W61_03590 [Deltaproteobacteria bacterium 